MSNEIGVTVEETGDERRNSLTTEETLRTTARYYRFVRSWTMTDPVHAKVELVTNSVDALLRHRQLVEQTDPTAVANVNSTIEIEEDLQERTMKVRDFATGMRADKMRSALLVIGAKTSEGDGARGTFSTGAKNVSQLGRVTWQSIRDDKYSSCYITLNGTGAMLAEDVDATDEHRAMLRLDAAAAYPRNSGTTVTLHYSDHVQLQRGEHMLRRFLNYFAMRDILHDATVQVRARYRNAAPGSEQAAKVIARDTNISPDSIHAVPLPLANGAPADGEWSDWFALRYQFPERSTLIERFGFQVPDYPQATAYFEVYKSPVALSVPEVFEEDTLQFGFTIATGRAVHEHSCFWPDLRTNEDMRYFYGRLRCDYIDTLLQRYDDEGPTADNPVAIIDPGRLYGLNRGHPFVQWLLTVPTDLMRLKLRELRDAFDRENGIASEDVLNLVGNLETIGAALFEAQMVELEWRDNERGRLIKAVRENSEKFVFVRDADLYELHNKNPRDAALGHSAEPTFVFADDQLISQIEQNATAGGSDRPSSDDSNENKTLLSIRINGRGELVDPADDDDENGDDDDEEKIRTRKPRLRVEIIYSDNAQMRKRYRADIDGDLLRVTINTRSPCFGGMLRRDPVTNTIVGLEKVSPILVETLVHAFTRLFVEQKINSAAKRNVVHANNAAAAAELKYAEEYDEALILIEREIYRRIAVAIANGALENDGVVTLDEVMAV